MWMHRDLKCWPEYFQPICDGTKTVEVRLDDRGYQVGDVLRLHEWALTAAAPLAGHYTGRTVDVVVTHILRDIPGLGHGFVAMSIRLAA